MSTSDPYALWLQVGSILRDAAALAGANGACWPVRGRAAHLCRTLAAQIAPDEALCADVMHAASACIETFPVVHDLLLAALELALDPTRLVLPIRRLCRHAHEAHNHDTVVVALLELLELDSSRADLPAAWLLAAIAVDGEADYWLRRLVRRWVELLGAEHEGIRAIVRDRADQWFPTRRFRLDVLRAMHAAEPTASGWVALASRRSEMEGGPLGIAFGDRRSDAMAALCEALMRPLPAAAHAALEGWLLKLSR